MISSKKLLVFRQKLKGIKSSLQWVKKKKKAPCKSTKYTWKDLALQETFKLKVKFKNQPKQEPAMSPSLPAK